MINLEFRAYKKSLEGFADGFGMALDHDAEAKTARFRRNSNCNSLDHERSSTS